MKKQKANKKLIKELEVATDRLIKEYTIEHASEVMKIMREVYSELLGREISIEVME